MNTEPLIPRQGNYKDLKSYRKANVIFVLTYHFCHRAFERGDRTIDQMIQAARSGKQNIAEGTSVSGTSSKTEIKLINVAKASLKELLEDYEDYLAVKGFDKWAEHSKEFEAMRHLGATHDDASFFLRIASTRDLHIVANMVIILLHQTDYLLFRQLQTLERNFLERGGFTERMYRLRNDRRNKQNPPTK